MHGRDECAGNVQELCAMKYTSMSVWWRFVQCQNFQGRYEVGKPETALKCAHASDIDWVTSGVGDCAGLDGSGKGTEGIALLQESVIKTKEMGIECVCRTTEDSSRGQLQLTYALQEKLYDCHQQEVSLHP